MFTGVDFSAIQWTDRAKSSSTTFAGARLDEWPSIHYFKWVATPHSGRGSQFEICDLFSCENHSYWRS